MTHVTECPVIRTVKSSFSFIKSATIRNRKYCLYQFSSAFIDCSKCFQTDVWSCQTVFLSYMIMQSKSTCSESSPTRVLNVQGPVVDVVS